MKFIYLAIVPFLTGCVSSKAEWQPQSEKPQIEVDATSAKTLSFLKERGYINALITGTRTEDCLMEDVVIGHGVLVKTFNDSGSPVAKSAVVCVTWLNNRIIEFDSN